MPASIARRNEPYARRYWSLSSQTPLVCVLACVQTNQFFEALGIWVLASGVVGFFAMGIDKARATGGEWRLSVIVLLVISLAGGALGVGAGSLVFRHKTSKLSFLVIFVPILLAWLYILRQIDFLSCLGMALP